MDEDKCKGSIGDACALLSKDFDRCIMSFHRTGEKKRQIHLLLLGL